MKTLRLTRIAPVAAIAVILIGAGSALAKDKETNEAQFIASAKVTIAQAIDAAEKATGGKATSAGIEDENGAASFEVTVIANGAEHKVLVDPQSGKVLKTAAADTMHEAGESGESSEHGENGENDAD